MLSYFQTAPCRIVPYGERLVALLYLVTSATPCLYHPGFFSLPAICLPMPTNAVHEWSIVKCGAINEGTYSHSCTAFPSSGTIGVLKLLYTAVQPDTACQLPSIAPSHPYTHAHAHARRTLIRRCLVAAPGEWTPIGRGLEQREETAGTAPSRTDG